MKIQFNLEYQANFGENLAVNIRRGTDEDAHVTTYKMHSNDGGSHWQCEVMRNVKASAYVDYYYSVQRGDETERTEWLVEPHRLEFSAQQVERYTVWDHWIDIPEDSYMYSSALTECVMRRERQLSAPTEYRRTLRLKVRAPQLRVGERLALTGGDALLGQWSVRDAVAMAEHEYHEWVVSLDADQLPKDVELEMKFIIMGGSADQTAIWEQGENRRFRVPQLADGEVMVCELPQAQFPVYPWKGAGTVIPIFSLRSEGSCGVGDLGDLKMLVDWADKTQQRVLQVLPINDTTMTHTWQDSYPYNSISIYALHPQYVDLRQLPPLKDEVMARHLEEQRQELNALPQIDYERMMELKMHWLRLLFHQEWTRVSRRQDYKDFYEQNKQWLLPYAAFCYYRDKYGTPHFQEWPKNATCRYLTTHPSLMASKEVRFWFWVQYVLDQQMRSAHDYARQHRVVLKGDIPIGISRDGVEAWIEPRYFNMNGQAGAPPDAFATDGQNWGFPTYNWDEMLKDGCQWWVKRFRKMAEYFDAYRIDHVLGFFRIWEIPVPQTSGLEGQFSPALGLSRAEIEGYGIKDHDELFVVDHKRSDRWHPRIAVQYQEVYKRLTDDEKFKFNKLYNDYFYERNNQFWYREAMKKLPLLTQATRMLCCAEDLGMVPDCVAWVMQELRILSLEIQTMPKEPNIRFGKLSHNPYRSVCTFSTHDMAPLRQWWDEDEERAQQYYNIPLRRSGTAPHPLPGWLAKEIVSRQLTSPSMLCLLSLQDWLSMDERLRNPDAFAERINIPANPRHYWRWRMHLTLEQLLQADDFNDMVRTMVTDSGRR